LSAFGKEGTVDKAADKTAADGDAIGTADKPTTRRGVNQKYVMTMKEDWMRMVMGNRDDQINQFPTLDGMSSLG
jgi:hypothetical protein